MARPGFVKIKKSLDQLKKVQLAICPTPLEKLTRFGAGIGLRNLWIKRDDNTGLALGGNKARKLEYLVTDAQKKKCDTLFTIGGIQSNHVRMTAAAAKKSGMHCHIWLLGQKPEQETGNIFLDKLLGATIEYLPPFPDEELDWRVGDLMNRLQSQGQKPYYIPIGGSTGLGALGYVDMVRELAEQLKKQKLSINTIIHASGSGGTQAGTILGCALFLPKTRVIGISVSRKKESLSERVLDVIRQAEKILGLKNFVKDKNIIVYDGYIGEKYGIPTPEGNQAIFTLSQTEGILLDPVYTAKAMSGLVDLARKSVLDPKEKVLFIHTGGVPAIFAFEDALSPSLESFKLTTI